MNKDILNGLIAFGLDKNESIIYFHLLEFGKEKSPGKIAASLKIHRQYVYNSLQSLEKLGLVIKLLHGKFFKYKAVEEKEIINIAKQKLGQAEILKKELSKFSKVNNEQDFEIFIGEENIQNFELKRVESLAQEETQYLIAGSNDKYLDLMKDLYLEKLIPIALKKKSKIKHLGNMSLENKNFQKKYGQEFESRILPGFNSGELSILVSNNCVYFYTYVNPPTIYIIKSEKIYKGYLELFNSLWNLGIKN
jgi:sugar-specific transcriptional regulator TrmB